MINGIMMLNQRGDVLISRNYRMEELSRGIANAFRFQVIAAKEVRSPVKQMGNTNFFHIRSEDIYLVAITKFNADATLIFETLYKIAELFKAYYGGKFDEETLKGNLILTYELLDEIMDYGYPQNLTADTLKGFVTQKNALKDKSATEQNVSKLTTTVTGATPWRTQDIFYKKNELFIDVVESVNLLVSAEGKRLRADVSGSIQIRCYLSGMPECKFGLNDKLLMDKELKQGGRPSKTQSIAIDDFQFHQCVKLGKFDTDRTISFVPPDGEFELMKYRSTENVEVPFSVTPIVKELSKTRLEVKVAVKSNFKPDMFGTSVKVKIPLPKNTALCKVFTQAGKGKYTPEENAIVWKIRRFPGETKYILGAEVELSATVVQKKAWSRPPISMEFQVPMFTASGLHVRFLKVLEAKMHYQAIKWVRYLTQAGSYQVRI